MKHALLVLGSFLSVSAHIALATARPPPAGEEKEGDKVQVDADWLDLVPWRSIGPANMGGRITDIAVSEKDPSLYWVATASGGLIKTANGGITYEHQFDRERTVSIGAVAVAASDPSIVWVGTGESNPRNSVSYGDGVYKSIDGGKSFEHMGLAESFQIGGIAIHPSDPNVVYVGALGRLYGPNEERGLFKTTDGGKSWEKVLYVDERTGVIEVDMSPADPETLLVATYERARDGFDTNDPAKKWGPGSGVHKTTDGGKTWRKIGAGLPSVQLGRIGLDYYRKDPSIVFAVVETERIAKLPDDAAWAGFTGEDAEVGAKLTKIEEGGPAETAGLQKDDIVLAVGETKVLAWDGLQRAIRQHKSGETVTVEYARKREPMLAELTFGSLPEGEGDRSPFSSGLGGQRENVQGAQGRESLETGGVFKSTDGGETWTRINSLNPRPMYFSEVRVDPSDENYVYVLGIALYRSKDGGVTFTDDGAGDEVHVDHHALWIDPADGRHIMLGTDGGLYVTRDRMERWDHHNHVSLGQFYHVTVDNRPLYRVYGGLQDNGSWGGPNRTRTSSGPVNSDWFRVGGGDGFVCRVDPEDPDLVYSESQNGGMSRWNLRTGERSFMRPRGQRGVRYRFNWETPFALSHHYPRVFYSAGNYVFRSPNKGDALEAISPEITFTDQGSATDLSESPQDANVLYVGTDDGALWVTKDGGKTWIDCFDPWAHDVEAEQRERRTRAVEHLLRRFDANRDGRIAKAEVPEDTQEFFTEADIDASGELDAEEMRGLSGAAAPEEAEAGEAKPDPVSGKWNARLTGEGVPPESSRFELELQLKEGDALGGRFKTETREGEITSGTYDRAANSLTLLYEMEVGAVTQKGTIEGAKMTGWLETGGGLIKVAYEAERAGGPPPAKRATVEAPAEAAQRGEEEAAELPAADAEKKPKKRPTERTIAALLPKRMWVSSIEASRFDAGRVYVAFDGHRSDDDRPWVFVSEDYGETWKELSSKLPRGSSRVLREDLLNQDVLYLGTEFGAWISFDRGSSWQKLGGKLPTVAVHDFAQHASCGEVVVGTHGRGLWVFDATLLRQFDKKALASPAHLFRPNALIRWSSAPSPGDSGTRRFVGENPEDGVRIDYSLAEKAESIRLYIEGLGGERIRDFEPETKRGLHRIVWDTRRAGRETERGPRPGPRVASGRYLAVLEVDGHRMTQEIVIQDDPERPATQGRIDAEESFERE